MTDDDHKKFRQVTLMAKSQKPPPGRRDSMLNICYFKVYILSYSESQCLE